MEPMGFMNIIEGESPWRYFELDTRSGDLAWWLGNEIFGQTCGRYNSGRWYIYHIYIWYKWSKSSHSVERNCEWVCLFLKIGAAVIVWVARLDWWRQILLMPQWQTRRARNQPGYASDISNHLSRASTSACCLLTWKLLNGWILCPWLEVISAPPRVVALSRCSGTPAALEIFGDSTGYFPWFSMIWNILKHPPGLSGTWFSLSNFYLQLTKGDCLPQKLCLSERFKLARWGFNKFPTSLVLADFSLWEHFNTFRCQLSGALPAQILSQWNALKQNSNSCCRCYPPFVIT